MTLNETKRRHPRWLAAGSRMTGYVTLFVAAAASACSAADAPEQSVGVARQAIESSDCGYAVTTTIKKVSKKGFRAVVKITNTSGKHLDSSSFTLLVNAGAAELVHVGHGSFQPVENGYLLSTVSSAETADDCAEDDGTPDPDVLAGRAYRFHLKFEGAYDELSANIISSSGVACDQTAPTIGLSASGTFFTTGGTLTLSAAASDDVAVSKVVFTQDGVELGTVKAAPYVVSVPITDALNGRHRYTATAYDLTGNQASQTQRVLVAIGNKFFGTATTTPADYTNLLAHFDQITPGNAGKWGSVEATRDQMNWSDLDTAYAFAKDHHLPFKFHTLVWGQQQPGWLDGLAPDQQLAEIDQWMSAVAARYPAIDLIDVVNEPLHAPPSYAAALGGAGATGWDWVITAFEMARSHFPNAELLLNDYSILTQASTTQSYLEVVKLLQDRGLIDGIGEQGHFYERAPELSVLSANLASLAATGLPLYVSELDLNFANDAQQANRMRDLFSTFWSNPSVLGITHWGYLQGNVWQTNAYLIRSDGSLRPALTFIECYRAGGTDCAVPPYVPEPRTGDTSGITLEAEEYDAAHALLPAGNVVAYASDDSWFAFDKVVFDDNWDTLAVTYANGGTNSVNLSLHLDALDSSPVATVTLAPTGGWSSMKTISIPWAPLGMQKDLFVRFDGGGANVDNLHFGAPPNTGKNLVGDGDFEGGTTAGFWSWAAGNIANTTTRAVSGTHGLAMTARDGNSPLVQSLTSTVTPGKTYAVSLWATIGGAASASASVTTAIQCDGQETVYGRLGGWSNTQTITDGAWVNFAGDLSVDDCPLANVAIWLEGPGAGVDLYLDHVSVRAQSTANLVANGTFESGQSGWYTWNGGSISASSERAHGGTQSLLVSNRTSDAPAATDLTSAVKAGTTYPFSLWASIRTTDGSSQDLHVTQATTCQNTDGTTSTSWDWVAGPQTLDGGPGWSWVQFSGNVVVPSCTLAQLQLYVEGGVGADLFVDDVQVLDPSGGPNSLIDDGTFESGQGSWGGWGYTSLSVVDTTSHSGGHSLLGAGMQPNGAIARDILPLVAAGKRYQATAWVSVGNLAAGSGAVKFQTVQNCDATGDGYPWLAGATVNDGDWVEVTGTVDLTSCSTVDKLVLFVGADSGDLYVDDVTLTPLP